MSLNKGPGIECRLRQKRTDWFVCIYINIVLINNGIVLIKSPGTPGVYMDNSTSNTSITKIKHF